MYSYSIDHHQNNDYNRISSINKQYHHQTHRLNENHSNDHILELNYILQNKRNHKSMLTMIQTLFHFIISKCKTIFLQPSNWLHYLLNKKLYTITWIRTSISLFATVWLIRKLQTSRNAKSRGKPSKVAIIGSGIAGAGAAWSLQKSGIDVVLYERKPKVGGNAKSMNWNIDDNKIEIGLAVLAWPDELFHNYNALVDELGIESFRHEMKFFVSSQDKTGNTKCAFAHGIASETWLANDLAKWESLCAIIKRFNDYFSPSSYPTLYAMSWINPMNIIPLRRLCRLYGISQKFWDFVFVPIHTSTFLEVEMDTVPSNMAPILNDIVPFARTPMLRTWKTHAYDTIKAMVHNQTKIRVKTSCSAEQVEFFDDHVKVVDEDNVTEKYDAVIFACSAQSMNQCINGISPKGVLTRGSPWSFSIMRWLEKYLLSNVLYTTDRDKVFNKGIVHSHSRAIIPASFHDKVMNGYCNYIQVQEDNPREIENSFVLSSWAPTIPDQQTRERHPMLVSYNADEKLEGLSTEWVSTSREAHPCLTTWQLMSSTVFWPLFQGSRQGRAYFCGSAVLPGNGHDLSLLSGFVTAAELGAAYPFPSKIEASHDFNRLRDMMLGLWA